MASLSDISVANIFKGIILDSFMKDGFINSPLRPPPPQNFGERAKDFVIKHKKILITTAATITGLILGPVVIGGVVGALGFGEAGIAAGSVAAWLMSLHRGTVAAGSLVAILQSIGAAGLGIGGVIATGLGGGIFASAIAKALLNILESNAEGLAELEEYVSITDDNNDDTTDTEKSNKTLPTKVIFKMKPQLLNSNEKLKSFFKGFDLAQQVAKDKTRQFEFWVVSDNEPCINDTTCLNKHLVDTYGADNVTLGPGSYFLKLTD
ncbi:20086_t:CDS:1 [Entrophospora sp. SA101]|nr:11319_t:CDS:1 [Entrophospora sp. SA101]CAJ0631931.1 6984_t:CDS:1 [Entrophospora sp. SA101]CAJ0748819.1 16930_t:CDS:1 [Entrophospora sp. SA101]CAJ0768768.1 20086_t:CDS:1 [Entrophospora sp. SA101]CAJ0837013.1 9874_t:CDS:1 [Entrophospora sp. SA101]